VIGGGKSNYHTIMTMMAPKIINKNKSFINQKTLPSCVIFRDLIWKKIQKWANFSPKKEKKSLGFLHQKTDCHDITEILFKVALNTINLNTNLNYFNWYNTCTSLHLKTQQQSIPQITILVKCKLSEKFSHINIFVHIVYLYM
jgi:hypothetical protein